MPTDLLCPEDDPFVRHIPNKYSASIRIVVEGEFCTKLACAMNLEGLKLGASGSRKPENTPEFFFSKQ
jgi:hypothetical protein